MSNRNDQVFPVSLSEIAFTLVLVLMLLLGFMFLQEREARELAEQSLRDAVVQQDREAATKAFEGAKAALEGQLRQVGASDPDRLIASLTESAERAAENARLRERVLDLTKKLVALEDVRGRLETAGRDSEVQLTREEVERALVLQKEVERILSEQTSGNRVATSASRREDATRIVTEALAATRELRSQAKEKLQLHIPPGDEQRAVREIVASAGATMRQKASSSSVAALRSEIEKVHAQLRFYENRDKLRGLDHPPCWMDRDSRIEYIFNVQTVPEGFLVSRGWPAHREADARASDGFQSLMVASGALTSAQFSAGAKPFLDYGKRQSPECRHFVYLSSTIPNADRRDEARRLVNSFFYVLERKAPVTP